MSLLTNSSSSVQLSELPALRDCDPHILAMFKQDVIDPQKELAWELERHKKHTNSFYLDRSHPIEIGHKQRKELRAIKKRKV